MSKQELLQIIEKKRAELIDIVLKNGLNSTVSLKYSQELDKLLTQYIKDDHNLTKNKRVCS
ncbi:Spo0E family sporulation regulatory protein-aspartic acid phosphatase [Metabacillus litoralis]|uniref:Spo0E family sporulation regulatory protein-aspartic acid phosphatase n=1 Tax=Metabacillus litoralis TaxID=152268 RepID=UPI001CFD83BB|nr:aspartyl-phosphate phosphatase Spo0E family protein [Metabacillus litoralis]